MGYDGEVWIRIKDRITRMERVEHNTTMDIIV